MVRVITTQGLHVSDCLSGNEADGIVWDEDVPEPVEKDRKIIKMRTEYIAPPAKSVLVGRPAKHVSRRTT